MLDCDFIMVISNPPFPRDQVCIFTSTGGPIPITPNIRGQILLQKVQKCSQHSQRSHQWLANLTIESSWGQISEGTKCKYSPHTQESYPWRANLSTENGFNLACICHFLPLSCPWTKLLSTISKQPITRLHDTSKSYNIDDNYDDGIVCTAHNINKEYNMCKAEINDRTVIYKISLLPTSQCKDITHVDITTSAPGCWGSQNFYTFSTWRCVSPMHWPPLPSRKYPRYSFLFQVQLVFTNKFRVTVESSPVHPVHLKLIIHCIQYACCNHISLPNTLMFRKITNILHTIMTGNGGVWTQKPCFWS